MLHAFHYTVDFVTTCSLVIADTRSHPIGYAGNQYESTRHAWVVKLDFAPRFACNLLTAISFRCVGVIVSYNGETGQHHVDYADGDSESLHLGVESVRLLMHALEQYQLPSAETLDTVAGKYLQAARQLEQELKSRPKPSKQPKAQPSAAAAAAVDGEDVKMDTETEKQQEIEEETPEQVKARCRALKHKAAVIKLAAEQLRAWKGADAKSASEAAPASPCKLTASAAEAAAAEASGAVKPRPGSKSRGTKASAAAVPPAPSTDPSDAQARPAAASTSGGSCLPKQLPADPPTPRPLEKQGHVRVAAQGAAAAVGSPAASPTRRSMRSPTPNKRYDNDFLPNASPPSKAAKLHRQMRPSSAAAITAAAAQPPIVREEKAKPAPHKVIADSAPAASASAAAARRAVGKNTAVASAVPLATAEGKAAAPGATAAGAEATLSPLCQDGTHAAADESLSDASGRKSNRSRAPNKRYTNGDMHCKVVGQADGEYEAALRAPAFGGANVKSSAGPARGEAHSQQPVELEDPEEVRTRQGRAAECLFESKVTWLPSSKPRR